MDNSLKMLLDHFKKLTPHDLSCHLRRVRMRLCVNGNYVFSGLLETSPGRKNCAFPVGGERIAIVVMSLAFIYERLRRGAEDVTEFTPSLSLPVNKRDRYSVFYQFNVIERVSLTSWRVIALISRRDSERKLYQKWLGDRSGDPAIRTE